jgi:hypothetical protein
MLSKMHTNRRRRPSCNTPSSLGSPEAEKNAALAKDDRFRVQASPLLPGSDDVDSCCMGASSGRAFMDVFKRKLKETGKSEVDLDPDVFFNTRPCQPLAALDSNNAPTAPPRLLTDRCVNVYFQEWAPLFPVLHKPTFLRTYEDFVADPEKVKDKHQITQLYLVFSIAGLMTPSPDVHQLAVCEEQWTQAIDSVLMENTMSTLQCLIMAILCCIIRADYERLQHYKAIAVGLSHRLGLHQSQKRFSFGALTIETRKKVFWTLYTLDCFSAAILGLPKLLKEDDIQTEYPSDTDDEYVTEKGFQPTLPGEYTRLSSALALFRATRILARVLDEVYPATTPHELSLHQLGALGHELDSWYEDLPPHLRLNFAQDKPSTDVTGSRSPLLAIAYHFIRTLIYRPAVGTSLGPKAAPALLSIGDSSKHIVQIIQLLEERSMAFAFCLNKMDVLLLCGMTLLYRTMDLNKDSKLMREDERLVNVISGLLAKTNTPLLADFNKVASSLITLEGNKDKMRPPVKTTPARSALRTPSKSPVRSPQQQQQSQQPQQQRQQRTKLTVMRHTEATASESDLLQQQEKLRRMTMSSIEGERPRPRHALPRQSFDGSRQHLSFDQHQSNALFMSRDVQDASLSMNRSKHPLNYLAHLGDAPSLAHASSPAQAFGQQSPTSPERSRAMPAQQPLAKSYALAGQDWETMLASMDSGVNNVYDAIYGGPSLVYDAVGGTNVHANEWSPDSVDLSSFSIGELDACAGPAQSVHSLSEESLSSGEEVGPSELNLGGMGSIDYPNTSLAINCGAGEGFIFEGLEGFSL